VVSEHLLGKNALEVGMAEPQAFPHDHQKHLVIPPPEYLRAKLEIFGRDLSTAPPLPFICQHFKDYSVSISPDKPFDPHIGELQKYIFTLKPESLDHLKEITGIPNQVLEHNSSCAVRHDVCLHHLPPRDGFSFESLKQEQRTAVRNMALNLLYGPTNKERVSRPPLSGVVEFMLHQSARLPIFLAPDLVVCPNHKITFSGFAALVFNNVVVYGNGSIEPGNRAKLHAYQISHVPA
jgi:hypothetical protein